MEISIRFDGNSQLDPSCDWSPTYQRRLKQSAEVKLIKKNHAGLISFYVCPQKKQISNLTLTKFRLIFT